MTTRLFPLVLVVTAAGVASLAAADSAPHPPAYVLKNKSSFGPVSDEQRAPFWPIGWAKRKPNAPNEPVRVADAPKFLLDEKNFKVTSILLGSPSFAIINGRTYSEGEFIRLPRAAAAAAAPATAAVAPPPPRTRLYRISDGSVTLQCQDQLITIALQRPELVQRHADTDLLSEDR